MSKTTAKATAKKTAKATEATEAALAVSVETAKAFLELGAKRNASTFAARIVKGQPVMAPVAASEMLATLRIVDPAYAALIDAQVAAKLARLG